MTNDKIMELYNNFFKNRNIDEEERERFITPDYKRDILDPFIFIDMDKAVKRLKSAIDNKEKILIYTDYDCDGIPAGTILYDFFKKINYNNFENYIPHRHKEGYGLHKAVIEKYIKNGYTLMITADLGITNVEEVKYSEENGMNVILTDHHLPLHKVENINGEERKSEILPPAYTILNVQLQREKYINKGLCGCGTAWKLICGFLSKYREEYSVVEGYEKWLLDMVALSTVADMMPLTGENRALVHYGLKVLAKSPRAGLQKIFYFDKVKQSDISEMDISFTVAPRINSAGRLDHPIKAFYALSDFENKGIDFAVKLDTLNKERKRTVKDINNSIIEEAKNINENIIFIGNEKWPIGVVGLVAQEIVKVTGKTTFIWGLDENGIVKGSSRAGVNKINVTDLSASISDLLIHFGGHEAAGGFAFENGKQEEIKNRLLANYDKYIIDNEIFVSDILSDKGNNHIDDKVDIVIDMSVDKNVINKDFYKMVRKLAPFGIGNNAPIFKIKYNNETIKSYREFGKNKEHIEININGLNCIKFFVNNDEKEGIINSGELIGNIEYDNWTRGIRLKII